MPQWETAPLAAEGTKWSEAPLAGSETDTGEIAAAEKVADVAIANKQTASDRISAKLEPIINLAEYTAHKLANPSEMVSDVVNLPNQVAAAYQRWRGLVPPDYVPPKLESPVTPEDASKVVSFFSPAGVPRAGSVEQGAEQFASEFLSSAAAPENAVMFGLGMKYPEMVGRYFQAQMISDLPKLIQQWKQAGSTDEQVKLGLQTITSAALPLAIEKGLRARSERLSTPSPMRILESEKGPVQAEQAIEFKPIEQSAAAVGPATAEAAKEAKLETPTTGVQNAIDARKVEESLQPQRQQVDARGIPTETSVSDQLQRTEEVRPLQGGERAQGVAPGAQGEIRDQVEPKSVDEILKPPDPIEDTLTRWIDNLGKPPPGLMADPLFVQSIGRPVARLALMAARETYRTGKKVAEAVEEGIKYLRTAISQFDENEARAWLKSVMPTATEATAAAASEKASLKEVLKKSEAAGEAGIKAGAESMRPIISELRDKLSDSISKASALNRYFAGQEKGAKAGAESARKDAEKIDRWLAADSENIRESLTDLANGLPVSERGKFISAITSAIKRPALYAEKVKVGGKIAPETISVIENMYRKAAKVASRIENRIDEVEIEGLENEIGKFKRWQDSPSVDVEFRKQIRSELAAFDQLRKSGGLPRDALIALRDRLVSLRDIGRSEQTVKQALWEWQKEFAERELQNQETRKVETRPELRPRPGDSTPISMRLRNWLNNARNKFDVLDKALMPIDALFDLMEEARGKYTGWLFRHARGPVDLGFNAATARRRSLLDRFEKFINATGLTAKNAERIGVYAQNLQEGGRQRLIEMGLSESEIDQISGSLSNNELAAYRLMRKIMDSQLPEVTSLMRKLYNTEVKSQQNYFPMPRDWRVFEKKPEEAAAPGTESVYDDLATWKALMNDYFPHTSQSARKGFTIERQKGAKTPIRIDAFDIFRQHINDVSYLIEMQPTLKRIGEIGRGDLFKEKYGDVGQKIFLDWVDTVARQGGIESFKRWKMLDVLRKNTSVGVIGFRVASQFVHESNVPYIYARIGNWFGTGMREAFTERGKSFIKDHFLETQERGGGEPAQVEAEKGGVKLGGITVIPEKAVKASYSIARGLDRINSQASVLGAYLKALSDKGQDWQNYDSIPFDKEAANNALVMARRAIASPLPKDVPQALSRGRLTGGNVSIGRSLFQFQNIFLDQWSNIRHDLWQAGIRSKNPKMAAQMTLAVLGAIVLETGIKVGVKSAIQSATGYQPKKEEDPGHKAIMELLRRFPFGGQVESQLTYGNTGIPVLDSVIELPKSLKQMATAGTPEKQQKGAVRALGAGMQLLGIPGSSQVSEVIEKSMP